jgi:hypothetical protein
VELIETPAFTRQVQAEISDEEYRALQMHLMLRPDAGDLKNVRSNMSPRELRILRNLVTDD